MTINRPQPTQLAACFRQPIRDWRPFNEARDFARSLGLKTKNEWIAWSQNSGLRPADIPATPAYLYAQRGWAGWGDWLGTSNRRGDWRPFDEARALVRTLGLKNQSDWLAWARSEARPVDIPCQPNNLYQNSGWAGWRDWLGTSNRLGPWRPFDEARTLARSLGLSGQIAWLAWSKSDARPVDIPANAPLVYKDQGWLNWSDWLGTRHRRGGWRAFDEARALARSLGLAGSQAWTAWARSAACPSDIPIYPQSAYRYQGWASWADWLGTSRRRGNWRPFEEARALARSLGIANQRGWVTWARSAACPSDIPIYPQSAYRHQGWASWTDWLGREEKQ